jgi:spore coat polysaccharide biosynthesis protein SpsF (cytidylyltransferase family)
MNCPERILLKIKSSKYPVDNLILYIEIIAREKNNYGLGPLKTDQNGEVEVTRKMIEKEIHESKRMFIMDYSSNIEECSDEIIIKISSQEDLQRIRKNLQKFYPNNLESFDQIVMNANNSKVPGFKGTVQIKEEIILTID